MISLFSLMNAPNVANGGKLGESNACRPDAWQHGDEQNNQKYIASITFECAPISPILFIFTERLARSRRSLKQMQTSGNSLKHANIMLTIRLRLASLYTSQKGTWLPVNTTVLPAQQRRVNKHSYSIKGKLSKHLPKFSSMKLKAELAYAMVSVPVD